MPDTRHGPTLLEGSKARFARNPPKPKSGMIRRFKRFVERQVVEMFEPLPADADVSVSTWLKNNDNYSEARKAELLLRWNESEGQVDALDLQEVDLFTKTETYMAYKHARGINSRSDVAKCLFGPYFALIEEEVYKNAAFIKHIPVCQRPKYIMDMLGHFPGPFLETDYTAFESHFTPEIMSACEMVLYKHMLQNFPEMYSIIKRVMTGVNRCKARTFVMHLLGRRMSGEMCTSLGNGFSNLMLMKFAVHVKGGEVVGVVEGDDGLFHSTVPVTSQDFLDLGFLIKILEHRDLLRSSFCGLVMSSDGATMTDPWKTLLNFGWTHSRMMNGGRRVLMELLRAKALSLAYEHPQCPILSVLAKTVLRHTTGWNARFEENWYESQLNREIVRFSAQTEERLAQGPSLATRMEFHDHYGISVATQLAVEEEISGWRGGPLDGPHVRGLFADEKYECLRHYFETYSYRGYDPCL